MVSKILLTLLAGFTFMLILSSQTGAETTSYPGSGADHNATWLEYYKQYIKADPVVPPPAETEVRDPNCKNETKHRDLISQFPCPNNQDLVKEIWFTHTLHKTEILSNGKCKVTDEFLKTVKQGSCEEKGKTESKGTGQD